MPKHKINFNKDEAWDNLLQIMNQQPQANPSDFFRISEQTRNYLEAIHIKAYSSGFIDGVEKQVDLNLNKN